jgi:hypothetical protein
MCRDQTTAVPRGFEGPSGGMQIDARSLGRGVRSVGATFQAYIKTTEWDAGTLSARNKVWWPAAIFGATSTRTPIEFSAMSRWRAYSKRSMAAVSRNRNRPTRDRGCDAVRRHGTVSKQCCRWHGLIIIGPPTGPPWASRSLARSCCKLRTQPTEGMSDGDSSRPSIRTFLTKVIIIYTSYVDTR